MVIQSMNAHNDLRERFCVWVRMELSKRDSIYGCVSKGGDPMRSSGGGRRTHCGEGGTRERMWREGGT
jgi:hypothetical protein